MSSDTISYLNKHNFDILLSFDGKAQELGRYNSSLKFTENVVLKILNGEYDNLRFSVNSVFSPETVHKLYESVCYLLELGLADIRIDTTEDTPWNDYDIKIFKEQMFKLARILVPLKEKGKTPVSNFKPPKVKKEDKKIFVCRAGNQRITISPEGNIWGCHQFYYYLKKNRHLADDYKRYSLGTIDDYLKKPQTLFNLLIKNYSNLHQNYFSSEDGYCFLCDDLYTCAVCPVYAARSTNHIGKIPNWVCKLRSIQREIIKEFEFGTI